MSGYNHLMYHVNVPYNEPRDLFRRLCGIPGGLALIWQDRRKFEAFCRKHEAIACDRCKREIKNNGKTRKYRMSPQGIGG